MAGISIRDLFARDPGRPAAFSLEENGLFLDFSRQRLDRDVLDTLVELARQVDLSGWIDRLFSGYRVNSSEGRAALHMALRRPASSALELDGVDIMPDVEAERARMRELADALHAGELKGYSGKAITDVVNIGIGGSDLGIVMATQALAGRVRPGLGIHCVSNIDGVMLSQVLSRTDPERTLFVICSKTFTTLETLTNARAARSRLLERGGEAAVQAQCYAVSTNHAAMDEFGIAPQNRFAIWDWVGGRYSIWSAVGLTIALAIGRENFDAFLRGANQMDEHFGNAPFERNLPVILALIGIWNRNFLDIPTHAVLPYDEHLARLPAYLQQLEMESNGKSVRRSGTPVESGTCPVIWGEPGSNAQHSFYQLLHQGTDIVSVDFLLTARSGVGRQAQQDLAAANCLAQAWAFAVGDPASAANSEHEQYAGNRPNSLLMFERLDPETLGGLVALYEHKVYVQGVIWDVNSFDQWGVQVGKRLASSLDGVLRSDANPPAPIAAALRRWRRFTS